MLTDTAIVVARTLLRSARDAHRESQRMRRLARERMAALRAFCAEHGITLDELEDGGARRQGPTDGRRH